MRPLPSDITKCNYFTQYNRDIETKKIVRKHSTKWVELSTLCAMIASDKLYWDNFDVVKKCISRLAHKHKISELEYIQLIKDDPDVTHYIDRLLSYNNICKGIENTLGTCWINTAIQFLLGIDEIANEEINHHTLMLTKHYKETKITTDILQHLVEKTCPVRSMFSGKIIKTSKDLTAGFASFIILPIIKELRNSYPSLFSIYATEMQNIKYDTKYILFSTGFDINKKIHDKFLLHEELLKRNYELRSFTYEIIKKDRSAAHGFTVRLCNGKYQIFDDDRIFNIDYQIVLKMLSGTWDFDGVSGYAYQYYIQQNFVSRGIAYLLYVKKDIE